MTTTKLPLPKGKITMRWIASRTVYQIYIAGKYINGANGSDSFQGESQWDSAVDRLCATYDVPAGTEITLIWNDERITQETK